MQKFIPKTWPIVLLAILFIFTHCTAIKKENGSVTAPSAVEMHGQLKVVGNRIVDKNNKPVQLRGMSFFWSQWQGQYYTPETVNWLSKNWKCNIVRAAMGVESGGYLAHPEAEKNKVITLVEAAIKEGIYVIIDWHDHKAEQHTEASKAFFTDMAKRFAGHPNIIYEIFNEPLDVSWSKVIKPYSETIIDAIRIYDKKNIIVCGTRTWSQRVDEAANDPIKKENIAYTLHYYAATHKQSLRDIAQKALDKNIALFVTEFGTCAADGNGAIDTTEARAWWKFLDDNAISWCNWSVADKKETASALMPNADTLGHWADSSVSPSGRLVREEIRSKNSR